MTKRKTCLLSREMSLNGAPKIALDIFESLSDKVELQIFSVIGRPMEDRFGKLGLLHTLSNFSESKTFAKRAQQQLMKKGWNAGLKKVEAGSDLCEHHIVAIFSAIHPISAGSRAGSCPRTARHH